MSINNAPVLILAYNRSNAFSELMRSLSKCFEADKFDLFVHIDAPNIFLEDNTDQEKIIEQCQIYKTHFKSLSILKETKHRGLASSVISTVSEIIDRYGKIIVIEDDLLLSNDCLVFLNDGLSFYEHYKRIWSITAYSPPLQNLNSNSVFFSYRSSSWAWATWKDRWDSIDWEISDFDDFLHDLNRQRKFCRGGYDLPEMLIKQMYGLLDSWAIRWCYAQSKQDMLSVYPVKNRVIHTFYEKSTHNQKEIIQEGIDNCNEYFFEKSIPIENSLYAIRDYYGVTEDKWKKWADNDNADRYKFELMANIYIAWKKISMDGHNVAEYFCNRGYEKIAIYGKGRLGYFLEQELNEAGMIIDFYIDRNAIDFKNCKVYTIDDDFNVVDVIVITITEDLVQTKKMLEKKKKGIVKTLMDVLKDR